MTEKPDRPLRSGWTTGACAAAAAKSAYNALLTGRFLDPVEIVLPKGQTPSFALDCRDAGDGWASAGIKKDAGDDPDVTHCAIIISKVRRGEVGAGVIFEAGPGVGTITKPGLPIPPGEPAINPVPRLMIEQAMADIALEYGEPLDVVVEVSVPGGAELARKTWNPRLGIEGGLSILGTTGIVRPFSCSAWIASIHRGVDVARAAGLSHVVGSTGSTSERTVQGLYDLPEIAYLDMGDFAGGVLKYLRKNPVERLSIAGGIGKMTKLAQGAMDLHSGRSQVDFDQLAALAERLGADPDPIRRANTALEAYEILGGAMAQDVADGARDAAMAAVKGAPVAIETLVVGRDGSLLARTHFE
jgi:cobalt-precorrin-5B (C1)-methyltransferase